MSNPPPIKELPNTFSGFRQMLAKSLEGIFEQKRRALSTEPDDLKPAELFKAFAPIAPLVTNDYLKRKVRRGKGEKHKRELYVKHRVEILNALFGWLKVESEVDKHSIRLRFHSLIRLTNSDGNPKRS